MKTVRLGLVTEVGFGESEARIVDGKVRNGDGETRIGDGEAGFATVRLGLRRCLRR